MKAIKCEMCGSNDIIKKDGYYVCENCGTKYTPDEARKLMVTIDNSEKVKNLYILARRAKETGNDVEGYKYYSELLIDNPNDWEAAFYTVLLKANQCTIAGIASAASSVSNCLDEVFKLVQENVDPAEWHNVSREVFDQVTYLGRSLRTVSTDQYKKYYKVSGSDNELLVRIDNISAMLINLAKNLDVVMSEWELSEEALVVGRNVAAANFETRKFKKMFDETIESGKARRKKLIRERNERIQKEKVEQYWSEHPEEKAELDNRLSVLTAKVEELQKEIEDNKQKMSQTASYSEFMATKKLVDEKNEEEYKLGMFKFKERKAINAQIESLKKRMEDLKMIYQDETAGYRKNIDMAKLAIEETQKEIEKVTEELTRNR